MTLSLTLLSPLSSHWQIFALVPSRRFALILQIHLRIRCGCSQENEKIKETSKLTKWLWKRKVLCLMCFIVLKTEYLVTWAFIHCLYWLQCIILKMELKSWSTIHTVKICYFCMDYGQNSYSLKTFQLLGRKIVRPFMVSSLQTQFGRDRCRHSLAEIICKDANMCVHVRFCVCNWNR